MSRTHGGNSQLESFLNVPILQFIPLFRPYKAICSTLKESWHVESLLQIYPPRPYKTIRSVYAESYHMVSFWKFTPSNLQNHTVDYSTWRKLTCWVIMSHCYRFIFRPPTKHFVRHMNQLGILSHVWNVYSFPYNKARRWTNKIGTSSHVWNLRPLDHTQQYIQHMDQIDMLIHSFGFTCPVPYETLCLVYEPAWHLDLCTTYVKMFLAFPYDKTIRWTPGKKGILSHFWNLQSLDPTKRYVKKTVRVDTSSCFYGESWHVELFFKFEPPSTLQSKRLNKCRKLTRGVILKFITSRRLHKAVPVIYEQSWHVESLFWTLNVLPPSPPIPFKALRSTYKPIWNLESLLCFFPAAQKKKFG